MPITGSRGLMSSRGFGQFMRVNMVAGSFALFMPSNTYYKYTFAADNWVYLFNAGINTLSANQVSAVSNADKGYFTVRSNQNGFLYLELRYWAAYKGYKNVNLVPALNATTNAGAGNSVAGVMTSVASDTVAASTSVINYASNTVTGGTTLSGPCQTGEAVGAPDHILFALVGTSLPQTNKYFYTDNSVLPGTNLTFNIAIRSPSIGNATEGIFCQGGNTTNTCKYVHASDTCATSTVLLSKTYTTRGFNNDVTGVIPKAGGTGTIFHTLWSFANDSVSASSANGFTCQCGAANGIPGLSA